MKKRKFLAAAAAFVCLLSMLAPTASANGPEALIAQSVILAERDSGTILYEYRADEQRSPDTMVKIMTVLLAAEAIENGAALRSEYVSASESAFFDITSESETRKIVPGESMPLIDLMYCAMVGGASEACNIIAEHISGSVDNFVAQMNNRARALGCSDTVFVNTHGQQDARQFSTARDLYKIVVAAAKSPVFTEVAGAVTYTVPATDRSAERSLTNTNYMLSESRTRYYYRYAIFGKVSATYESGYGCVQYSERNGMALVSVLLGSTAVTTDDGTIMHNMTDTKKLLEWGYSNYSWRTIMPTTQLVDSIPIAFGDGVDSVNLRIAEDVIVLLQNDVVDADVTHEIRLYDIGGDGTLTAPIDAGTVLGELDVFVEGKPVGTGLLVADASIELQRVSILRQKVKAAFSSTWFKLIIIVAAVLFVAYAAIVIRYNILRARHVKRVQAKKQQIAEQRQRDIDDFN